MANFISLEFFFFKKKIYIHFFPFFFSPKAVINNLKKIFLGGEGEQLSMVTVTDPNTYLQISAPGCR